MRVFDDGGGFASLWFELDTDRFWCGDDLADAEETRRALPASRVTEERLRESFGDRLTEVEPPEVKA